MLYISHIGFNIFIVDQILARTPPEKIQKLYDLPEFSSALEFVTMLALKSGRLLKVTNFILF